MNRTKLCILINPALALTLLWCFPVASFAADTKITAMTEATSVASTDILPVVINPGSSPANRKVTVGNLMKGALMTPVDGHADGNLTIADVSNTEIYNTGQADGNATKIAPLAAGGYSTIITMGTTRAGKAWCFKAKGTDIISLDGTATGAGGKVCSTPLDGNYMTCFTRTTATGFGWICRSGVGTWWRE